MPKPDFFPHKRDNKGKIIGESHYRLLIENGIRKYEIPPNSGEWFAEDGSPLNEKASQVEEPSVPVKEKSSRPEKKD